MFTSGFKFRLRAWLLSQSVISRKAWLMDCLFACTLGVCMAYGLFMGFSN